MFSPPLTSTEKMVTMMQLIKVMKCVCVQRLADVYTTEFSGWQPAITWIHFIEYILFTIYYYEMPQAASIL